MQVYVVFNSEHKTQQVTDSFRQLQNIVVDHALEELVFEVVVDDSEVADVHVDTLPCHSNATVRRTIPLNTKFMQPLNVGDHWITVANMLSTGSNEVQLYDSSYQTEMVKVAAVSCVHK